MPAIKLNIDAGQVEAMAAINCTDREIALVVGCSEGHLRTKLREALDRGRAKCKVSIKRELWAAMQRGNIAATIFLGKAVCGMREVSEVVNTNKSVLEEMTDDELKERREQLRKLQSARRRAGKAGSPDFARVAGEEGEEEPA